jgi:hypothetical protein
VLYVHEQDDPARLHSSKNPLPARLVIGAFYAVSLTDARALTYRIRPVADICCHDVRLNPSIEAECLYPLMILTHYNVRCRRDIGR